jgi:Ran GTPase-activating protein (RanGAP) involved in mRNA processing and transport
MIEATGRIAGKRVMEALKHNSRVKLMKQKQSFQTVLCPRHSVHSEKTKNISYSNSKIGHL